MTQTSNHKNFGLHLWDFLAWVTVLFPIFTGGLWIRRPGLYVELTQINVPVVALGILGAILAITTKADLKSATSARFLFFIWKNWCALFKKNPEALVWISGLFAGLIWSLVSCRRHWAFQSAYADLGIFDNAIWNLVHGNGYISSVKGGMNLLADHQSPIFFLLAPFYALYPHAETLLIAQGIGLALAGVGAFYLARQYLGASHKALPLIPLAYWAYFPVRNAIRFDFHPEVFMLPIFLFAIAGLQSSKPRNVLIGAIAFILGLATKESAGPVAAGIGMAWILGAAPSLQKKRARYLGVLAASLGVITFYIDLKIVPQYFAVEYQYQNAYEQFGTSVKDLLLAPFLQTSLFLKTLFATSRIKFFFQTIGPLALLPLLSPRTFIASAPGYLIYFLSSTDHRVNIGYHYVIESAVGIFWSIGPGVLMAEKIISKFFKQWNATNTVALAIIFCSLVGYGRSELFFIRSYQQSPHHTWLKTEVFPKLDPKATIAAIGSFVPHLTGRYWARELPILNMANEPGRYVDCLVWSQNPEVNQTPLGPDNSREMMALMRLERYKPVFSCDGLTIWQHFHAPQACLAEKVQCN